MIESPITLSCFVSVRYSKIDLLFTNTKLFILSSSDGCFGIFGQGQNQVGERIYIISKHFAD